MKKYILYTLLLIFAANVGYAQKDQKAIEAAKKRLLELRAKKAQIEQEMQQILQPDQIITTEIKDGVRTQTVKTKTLEEKMMEETAVEVVTKTPKIDIDVVEETPEPKISRRDRRRQKQTEDIDIAIEQPEEVMEETAVEVVTQTPEIEIDVVEETPEPKISRRDRRRQKQTQDIDIVIEQPEEVMEETAIEVVTQTPEVDIDVVEEMPEPKISRRDRRRQKQTQDIDIVIEQPEEVMEETAIEVVTQTPEIEVDVVEETPEPKISRRDRRRQKQTQDIDIVIEQPEEVMEETAIEVVTQTPEVDIDVVEETPEPKISRRDRRRQKQTQDIDIAIEQPEEVMEETAVEVVTQTPEIEIDVVEETPEPKISRRDRRRQKQTEDIDIVIEQPEEVIEETAIEVVTQTPEIEIDVVEETPEPKISRRDRRRQKQTQDIDIVIEQPEEPSVEMVVGDNIEMELPEEVAVETEIEREIAIETEESPQAEAFDAPEIEVNIQSTGIEIENTPEIDIEVKVPEVKAPPVEVVEVSKTKLSRKERRKLRQTENFDIKIESPEETSAVEIIEADAPEVDDETVTIIKDPEEEAIIAEIETAGSKKATLSIDVVDMPTTSEPTGVNLSDEAAFAMTDILTATPPESVPPEVTFYDAKLKLIVGEMEALATKSALLPSSMKRINDKLTTIESQLLKFDDMKSEPETAKYMNFMQMNIDILQNMTGDSNANSPTGMLMEPEPDTPSSSSQGAQKIYFMRDSDEIGFRFGKELEAVAATAIDIPALYLIIESMDESLQNKSPIDQKRADNIRNFLKEKGVTVQQIRSRYFNNTPDELSAQPSMKILIVDN